MSERHEPIDILVLGAYPPALRGLRPHIGEGLNGTIRGLRVTAKAVGVGMAAAGGSAAKRIFQLDPRAVIFLGTCGVYPGLPQYQPHDTLIAERFKLIDHSVAGGHSRFPEPMQTEVSTNGPMVAGLRSHGQRVKVVPVACPMADTVDDELASQAPALHGCHAECLEGLAVALAANLAEAPFTAVLGVTHVVGSYGEKDWRKFERQSSIAAAEILVNWIHTGAQGLPHSS